MSDLRNLYSVDLDFAASGDNTVIAAVTGRPIRVWRMMVIANAAVNVVWKHGSTAFNGHAWPITAQGSGWVLDMDNEPWFSTAPGEAFVMNLSGAVQMFGKIFYSLG